MTELIQAEKAWEFIEGKLQLANARQLLKKNQLEFLNEICYRVHHTIPFHNLAIVSQPLEERSCPDVEDNIKFVLSGFGGICWNINSAMFYILKAIELDVMPIIASIRPLERNHLMIVVRGVVKDGDTYLLEFGLGESSFRAMCLDFEGESEPWNQSIRSHKLVRDGNYFKHMIRSRVSKDDTPGGNPWRLQYDFVVEQVAIDAAKERVVISYYSNPRHNFSIDPRAVTFRDGKLIGVKGNILLRENSQHRIEATQLESEEDMLETMKRYFPVIPTDTVKKAMKQGSILQEIYGKREPSKVKTHVMQV